MKSPKIKLVDNIFRWDGISYERGNVSKIEGKYVTILVPGGKIRRKKEEIKWQKKYNYNEQKWDAFRWIGPPKDIIEILAEKTEGDWIKTYNRAGKLVSMKMTEESHSHMGQILKQ